MTSVALGADHAGWELKEALKAWLIDQGHQVLDFGTHSPDPVDYPDYAEQVAEAVTVAKVERGILVCGTGIGMAITANKVPGVRAAACSDLYTARMSREHNDANVLALGGRPLGGGGGTRPGPPSPATPIGRRATRDEGGDGLARAGGSGDRPGDPRRDGAAVAQPGADRLRELRLRGRARGHGLRPDQQVRRGLPGPALLRRLRDPGHRPGAGHRARQGAI